MSLKELIEKLPTDRSVAEFKKELADKAGVSLTTVRNWIEGEKSPRSKSLQVINQLIEKYEKNVSARN